MAAAKALAGDVHLGGQGGGGDALNALLHKLRVGGEEHGVLAGKVEQRHAAVLLLGGHIGHNGNLVGGLGAELRLHVEVADGVHLGVEEVYAVRLGAGVRVDVEDRASDGKLTRLIDVIGLAEADVEQLLANLLYGNLHALFHHDALGGDASGSGHFLGQGFGGGYQEAHLAGVPGVEGLSAENLRRRVGLPVFDVAAIARGEVFDAVVGVCAEPRQVMIYVAGGIGVVGYNDIGFLELFEAAEEHGGGRAAQSAEDDAPVAAHGGVYGFHRGRRGKDAR